MKPRAAEGVAGGSVSTPALPHSKPGSLSSTLHLTGGTQRLPQVHFFGFSFCRFILPSLFHFLSLLSLMLSVICDHLGPKCLFTSIQLKTYYESSILPFKWKPSVFKLIYLSGFIQDDQMAPSFNKTGCPRGLFCFCFRSYIICISICVVLIINHAFMFLIRQSD